MTNKEILVKVQEFDVALAETPFGPDGMKIRKVLSLFKAHLEEHVRKEKEQAEVVASTFLKVAEALRGD